MTILQLIWLHMILMISKFMDCTFPDIDNVAIIKNATVNKIIIRTNLNITIHCVKDESRSMHTSYTVECSSEEFSVIFQDKMTLNLSYRIIKSSDATNATVDGYRTVIYNSFGVIIWNSTKSHPYENNLANEKYPDNEMLLRCISPILNTGEYYNYKCWEFRVQYPIRTLALYFQSFEDLYKSPTIIWEIQSTEIDGYFVKLRNTMNMSCFSRSINTQMPTIKSKCSAMESYFKSPNRLQIINLEPMSEYIATITPFINSKSNKSSEIRIKTAYGSSANACFADCIFESNNGSIKYTGIRQVNANGSTCDEVCSTKNSPNRVTCPIKNAHYDCDIPTCTYKRLPGDTCRKITKSQHSQYTQLSWEINSDNVDVMGYIVLFYINSKCIKAYVFSKVRKKQLGFFVRSHYLPCKDTKFIDNVRSTYTFDEEFITEGYSSYVISILNRNHTGFVAHSSHIGRIYSKSQLPVYMKSMISIFTLMLVLLVVTLVIAAINRFKIWWTVWHPLNLRAEAFLFRTDSSNKIDFPMKTDFQFKIISKQSGQFTLGNSTEFQSDTETETFVSQTFIDQFLDNKCLKISTLDDF